MVRKSVRKPEHALGAASVEVVIVGNKTWKYAGNRERLRTPWTTRVRPTAPRPRFIKPQHPRFLRAFVTLW